MHARFGADCADAERSRRLGSPARMSGSGPAEGIGKERSAAKIPLQRDRSDERAIERITISTVWRNAYVSTLEIAVRCQTPPLPDRVLKKSAFSLMTDPVSPTVCRLIQTILFNKYSELDDCRPNCLNLVRECHGYHWQSLGPEADRHTAPKTSDRRLHIADRTDPERTRIRYGIEGLLHRST